MKSAIKSLLKRNGLYYGLKYSFLFRMYQLIFKPNVVKDEKKEILFYQSFLSPCHLIFDIGAYDGHKTEAFLRIAEMVVSCEPDPESFSILKSRFRKRNKRVFLENKAVAESEGERNYYIHHPGSAFNTLNTDWKATLEDDNLKKWDEKITFSAEAVVKTTTLDLLIEKYGTPAFIKIDVEGYERYVLDGLSQPVACLSFEGLWPDGKTDIQYCIDRIQRIDPNVVFNVAENETLLLPNFVSSILLLDWLTKNNIMHLEIVAKMKQ
jgi:FkbM family methyltransferase